MIIELNVSDKQKLEALVQLLQSMDFVNSIRVLPEEKSITTDNSVRKSSKYWGAWKKDVLSTEQIDAQIKQMREEWQRDIS